MRRLFSAVIALIAGLAMAVPGPVLAQAKFTLKGQSTHPASAARSRVAFLPRRYSPVSLWYGTIPRYWAWKSLSSTHFATAPTKLLN